MSKSGGSSEQDILTALAYELKNPLVVIAGQASLVNPKNKDKNRVKAIQNTAEKLLKIIDDTVATSQFSKGAKKPNFDSFDIRRVIQKAYRSHEEEMKSRKQGFVLKTRQKLPAVSGDQNLTYQIVQNLIGHACVYSPEKTDIAVSVRLQENEIQILVWSQGASVDQRSFNRAIENIGDYQQPLPQNVGDTGLRLFISEKLAESMNGQIRFIPSKHGSCFALSLPTNEQLRLL